jgi:ribonuclease PH
MRKDNRRYNQLRDISITHENTSFADGAVQISFGLTKILCTASISEDLPTWLHNLEKRHGWITAEYAMLPMSTPRRINREVFFQRGRSQEIQRLIGRSLRAAVDLANLGERTVHIDCDVIQADGGTRVASINGGYIALAIALKNLINTGMIPQNTLKTNIAAVSVCTLSGNALLDPDYAEDSQADIDANFVMNGDNQFIEIQCSAEKQPIDDSQLQKLLSLARIGITEIIQTQQKFLEKIS